MNAYQKLVAQLQDRRCKTCHGAGVCDDMHPGDIMCNQWTCTVCLGTGLAGRGGMPVATELEDAVKMALLDGHSASVIITPIINMLARLTVGVHNKTGSSLESLLDIIRNQLDEAVAHHEEPDNRPA